MADLTECVLGIGANLGDRERTLIWALEELGTLGQILCISNLYENPAIGGPPQPDYLNAAVRLRVPESPMGILAAVQHIERVAGRERSVRWGPRTLDLDLLWAPDQIIVTSTLELPHPRLTERAFALLPLVEVAPNALEPRTGIGYALLLEQLRVADLRLHSLALGPPWRWQRVRPRNRGVASAMLAS